MIDHVQIDLGKTTMIFLKWWERFKPGARIQGQGWRSPRLHLDLSSVSVGYASEYELDPETSIRLEWRIPGCYCQPYPRFLLQCKTSGQTHADLEPCLQTLPLHPQSKIVQKQGFSCPPCSRKQPCKCRSHHWTRKLVGINDLQHLTLYSHIWNDAFSDFSKEAVI